MGQPKLLLPWPTDAMPDGRIIDHVLNAWTSSNVNETVVIVRNDDDLMLAACEQWPVSLVRPLESPTDMKESVKVGLRFLDENREPSAHDRCFIAPADIPTLQAHIINRMIASPTEPDAISVASYGGRLGHPVMLPWPITASIFNLGKDEGVNSIVDAHRKHCVEFPSEEATEDVDTPQDYRQTLTAAQRRHL